MTAQQLPPLAERRKPGLSQTLHFFPHPEECQSCGAHEGVEDWFTRWRECDELDKPTMAVVVLCSRCSKKLIEAHPRLYVPLGKFEPFPGVMELCVDCRLRDGVSCRSPLAKHNGGPGMKVAALEPTKAYLNFGGGRGQFVKMYRSEPTSCAGREATT
jgi:hypothetical protein